MLDERLPTYVELVSAFAIPIAVVAVAVERMINKKGLGVRAIQFLGIATLIPAILVLALEGILEGSAVGAIIGALVGYLFSQISKYDDKARPKAERPGDV